MILKNDILQNIVELQQKYPNLYIGGSISLILQNAIPFRKIHDIDIIITERVHIYDIFEVKDREKHKLIRNYTSNGIRNELFRNEKAQFINYNYNGYTIKISPVDEVMEWKRKFSHIEKHKKDLEFYEKIN